MQTINFFAVLAVWKYLQSVNFQEIKIPQKQHQLAAGNQ